MLCCRRIHFKWREEASKQRMLKGHRTRTNTMQVTNFVQDVFQEHNRSFPRAHALHVAEVDMAAITRPTVSKCIEQMEQLFEM